MTKESRIAILGFGLGAALFALMQFTVFSKKGSQVKSTPAKASDSDMQVAASAYHEALANNEPQSVLSDLNSSFATQYNIQIQQQKSTGQLIITDMAGNQIGTYVNQ